MPQPHSQQPTAPFDLADALRRALALHQQGHLPQAEEIYAAVLAAQPDNFDALHLYGVLKHQRRQHAEALALIARALKSNARSAPAHSNFGNVLAALNRQEEAVASYDSALALAPDYAEALRNRGNAQLALSRVEAALASYVEAIALKPNDGDALVSRAVALRLLGRNAEAVAAYDEALAVVPQHAEAWADRGTALHEMRRHADASASFDRALALRPDHAEILNNRGNSLWCLQRPRQALASYDAALALKPAYAEGHNNRGNALLDLNRTQDALASFEQALALRSDYVDALVNRGNALRDLNRDDEALKDFDRAIALSPHTAEAHWNKSLLDLSRGDFARGWQGFEWRWQLGDAALRDFAQPQWRGEELRGQTILLHAEQGFGDTIQFVRYASMVAAGGGKVILEAPDGLLPLLGDIEGVTALVSRGAALPPFDWHCPLMSLPLAFGTRLATIPAAAPYLQVPAERAATWRQRLPRTEKPRVGLVWSGKPTHKNDHNRSIALARLAPLLSRPGIEFVSLQQQYRDADLAALEQFPALRRLDRHLADFADTAAAIHELDLVIAVDTAVAHLAGALAKPVWILLPYVQDWRWMLDRDDSPWYPSARLFRQPRIDDWDSVIAGVVEQLDRHGVAGQYSARLG
jgi:tetratricopeptide (TPR) repeat protein